MKNKDLREFARSTWFMTPLCVRLTTFSLTGFIFSSVTTPVHLCLTDCVRAIKKALKTGEWQMKIAEV